MKPTSPNATSPNATSPNATSSNVTSSNGYVGFRKAQPNLRQNQVFKCFVSQPGTGLMI